MNKNAILKRDIINMETELKDIFKEIESSNVILKLELGNIRTSVCLFCVNI